MPFHGKRIRNAAVAAAATLALGAGLFTGLAPAPSGASSHREAPLVAADPQIDGTDLYAFRSPDKPGTVTIISNWIPFEEPAGGPNFYSFAPGVRYDINIDNNGDAQADIVYRWTFQNHYRNSNTFLYNTGQVTSLDDPDLNFFQTYTLLRIDSSGTHTILSNKTVAPSDVGDTSMPNYPALSNAAIYSTCGQCQFWAGQADDPFFLDLRVFDLVYGGLTETGHDTLAGFNVNSFAMQVPKGQLVTGGDGSSIIGIWTTAERRSVRVQTSQGQQSFSGSFVQVSRLGNPLVNEVVVPVGKKDLFNASQPSGDGQFASFVQDPELPRDVNALYGFPIPDCDGNPNDGNVDRSCDLFPVFLTGLSGLNQPPTITASEELRLNTDTPTCTTSCSTLGVIAGDTAGFPNGRRLSDDVIDVALRVVEQGCLITNTCTAPGSLGDGVDQNDLSFLSSFPYLAYPHSGSDASPHQSGLRR